MHAIPMHRERDETPRCFFGRSRAAASTHPILIPSASIARRRLIGWRTCFHSSLAWTKWRAESERIPTCLGPLDAPASRLALAPYYSGILASVPLSKRLFYRRPNRHSPRFPARQIFSATGLFVATTAQSLQPPWPASIVVSAVVSSHTSIIVC